MDCLFCRIVAGDIPAFKVYEDDHTLSFMDINPTSEGHLLVLPKTHFENLFDADDEALGRVMAVVRKVSRAMRDSLNINSLNMVQANGPWAVQSIPHFHIHLIPRRKDDNVGIDWPLVQGDKKAIQTTGAAIGALLS